MVKTIVTTVLAITILLCAGFLENKQVNEVFNEFYVFLECTEEKLNNKTATALDTEILEKFWLKKKRTLHIWIPHNDIKEIDLWMAECVAYTNEKDYDEALCKIKVLKVLTKQVPFNFILKIENVF